MKILTRYIIKEFLKPLIFSALAFGIIVLISEFFRELHFYMENHANFLYVIEYLICNLPWWIIQVLPISVLLSVLFSLSALARHNEITAIKSAGINLWRILFILFICGLFIGLFETILREKIIPITVQYADHIKTKKIQKNKYRKTKK